MAASAAGLNHLISFLKKVQVHFGQDSCSKGIYFDHSEVDDVKEMLSKLPERLKVEKEILQTIIKYEK
ncbi:hypothetical protein [uncultured Treponema sp.]|uniref:hypothetical protein n=1 Tax=uncultured Treponema sp. TaxID=162155 RepID=UPI002590249F|nr:hypothetical protein [uncultured Treponema sp.]